MRHSVRRAWPPSGLARGTAVSQAAIEKMINALPLFSHRPV